MKKLIKWLLILIALIIVLVFANGCYYVFRGQERSMAKLEQGRELNLYECCSIYTMHMAVWMFGWPISPEAAKEAFWLHAKPDGYYGSPYDEMGLYIKRRRDRSDFYKLDKVKNHPNYKLNKPFRISWSTDLTKIPKDEIRYALAYNTPNTQVVFGYAYNTIEHPKDLSHWHPECINPWLTLRVGYGDVVYNFGHITIYTSLFKYLQDIGWLYPYDLTVGA